MSRQLLILIAWPLQKSICTDSSTRRSGKVVTIDFGNREAGGSRRRTLALAKLKITIAETSQANHCYALSLFSLLSPSPSPLP